ncbi:hypothetical protein L798_11353 [Zootermopsis nevadensis]|uniref:Uncharacterized protein n=1 Tax=Zootermopsis nevadensis TaxID=136037 RepID=A0A067RV73_ZOONE|nr:hypothetical protein L798_11353 [Zootermopsis nevadensis]
MKELLQVNASTSLARTNVLTRITQPRYDNATEYFHKHFNENRYGYAFNVRRKVREDRRFTISALSLHFPEISRTALYEIVTERLHYRKLCSRWVPKMLTEEHKKRRSASALTFLTRYHEEGDEMCHIVTGD